MSHLFNGVLKPKWKTPLPSQDAALKAMARGYERDKRVYEEPLNTNKIPMPLELQLHEMNKDEVLQDTILGMCDEQGFPLCYKYLANDLDDVMEVIQTNSFFDHMPMLKDYSYFVGRDWIGYPIQKYEMDSIARQRKIFEKRAIKKSREHRERLKKGKKMQEKSIQILKERKTLLF